MPEITAQELNHKTFLFSEDSSPLKIKMDISSLISKFPEFREFISHNTASSLTIYTFTLHLQETFLSKILTVAFSLATSQMTKMTRKIHMLLASKCYIFIVTTSKPQLKYH